MRREGGEGGGREGGRVTSQLSHTAYYPAPCTCMCTLKASPSVCTCTMPHMPAKAMAPDQNAL